MVVMEKEEEREREQRRDQLRKPRNVMEWVADIPFIISPRITFEVSVKLLSGLMASGCTIATILKRSSHVFYDDRVCVKIDWLEQLNRQYVQVLPYNFILSSM